MKKNGLLLIFLLLAGPLYSSGQGLSSVLYTCAYPVDGTIQKSSEIYATAKGNLLIGGGLSLRFRKGVNDYVGKSFTLDLDPKAMLFVAPSLAIGGTLFTTYYKYGEGDATDFSWGAGPALAYYIGGNTRKPVYPFIETSFIISGNGYVVTRTKLEFGVMYMVSDAVGLTTSLQYVLDSHFPEGSGTEHINNLLFSVGFRSFIFR